MEEKKRPILSISMLISNGRKDTIRKSMESLVPLRHALSTELILVDTGSKDGTIEIASEYADQVIHFNWCDDFSAARNAGLSLCSGEWFMFLDDDEWFEDVTEIIYFFQSGEYKKYGNAVYVARNYENFEGSSYTDTNVGRLCRMTPGLHFEGRIHEYLPLKGGDTYYLNCFVHHYGYVFRTEKEFKKHAKRNFEILLKAREEDPKDIRIIAHLVQEYIVSEQYKDAEKVCLEGINLCRELHQKEYYEYLILVLPNLYREQGRLMDAREETCRILKEEVLSKVGLTKLYAENCVLEKRLGNEEEVLKSMLAYIKVYEDRTNRGYALLDMLHYSTPICMERVLKIGIEAMFRKKSFDYAETIFSRIDWNCKRPVPYEWVSLLQQYFAESGDIDLFLVYSDKIIQVSELAAVFAPGLQAMAERFPEREGLFAEAVQRLRKIKVNPELLLLAEQMKGIIAKQIEVGNFEEAEQLLCEVKNMLPREKWIDDLMSEMQSDIS